MLSQNKILKLVVLGEGNQLIKY